MGDQKRERASARFEKDLLGKMLLIRRFEEKAAQMYGLKKIGGFCHLYIGQEAAGVGAIAAIDLARDYTVGAYRDHGYALACGMDPKGLMAELFGKATGVSKGKGGSMHFFDAGRHMFGGNGIVGAQIPVATGICAPIIPLPPNMCFPASKKCMEPPLPLELPVALPKSSAMSPRGSIPQASAYP